MDMKTPKVKLITFGGGGQNFRDAAARLITQSQDFPSIDARRAYTDSDLPPDYYELFSGLTSHKGHEDLTLPPPDYHELFSGLTGFGYYSWKPYLIHAELSKLEPDDILVHIDAGCELNKRGIRRFDDYLSHTSKNGVLLFEMQHQNRHWTKNHPKLLGYPEHYFRNQLAATIIFLKNNERGRQLAQAWLDLCAYENGVLLKPAEENEPQLPGFMKHRNDQSCLSLCAYQHDVNTIPDETWFEDWSYGQNHPILALRNRTGTSVLKERLKMKIFKRVKNFLRGH